MTCCIPSFDFRAPSAQACIVSALSATTDYTMISLSLLQKMWDLETSKRGLGRARQKTG